MIEFLTLLETGTCRNCGGEINHYAGDLGSDYWSHAGTGRQPCPDAPLAEPSPPTAPAVTESEG